MDKPVYNAMTEDELWNYLQTADDDNFEDMSKRFKISEANLSRLSILRYTGKRELFNTAFRQLHVGSPE